MMLSMTETDYENWRDDLRCGGQEEYGIARVIRVLAATIKHAPQDYDADVVEMASWVPPIRAGRDAERWFCSTIHRAYIQDLFRQYANLRKL
jgi:hypothetical protein